MGTVPPDGNEPPDGNIPPDGSVPPDGKEPPDGATPPDGNAPQEERPNVGFTGGKVFTPKTDDPLARDKWFTVLFISVVGLCAALIFVKKETKKEREEREKNSESKVEIEKWN